ncbi:Multi-sensor hybrid histidine kinase [Lysobacter dokdonensis DS-58]|uniref:histidine kinase n=2 Tax=Noviluteimonas TaxID=3382693 RepID=A0A0A2WMQ9_9GAMM|nr:Multi-sensor hybrid histidine kinase [Lysobacter dokdonensis DS-58]
MPTILIVDDNAATRYAMRRVVERQQWRVLEAATGEDGLAALRTARVDVLVLDVNLPDMTGFDLARRLREEDSHRLLPIVHVTAASIHTKDMIAGLESGADSYLIHPVDPGVLVATLRALLRVRNAEDALRTSEQRQRDILQNVAAPIAVVDAALRVHERNAAFDALHGGDEHLASRLAPGQDVALAQLREHVQRGERWHGALATVAGDSVRELEWRVVPYGNGQGLVFVEDVTRHRVRERQQNERLQSARSQLAEAISARAATEEALVQSQKMDALGQLTGGIAHDFNNLLTSIITSLGLLTDEAAEGRTQAVRQYADTALDAARRAASLTHRLLAFARRQPLDARTVDINARITSLEELLRRTIGERIALDITLDADAAIARVDAGQLENTILNLVVNARDALPGGGTIRIGTRVPDDAPEFVEVFVQDDGTGIPEDVLQKVFEPFFTTKPLGQGTGLGLSMTYGFARQSGGDVRIASTPGVGTTISLLLPVGDAAHVEHASGTASASAPVSGDGQRILIVEDADSVRELTATLLSLSGYRCLQAPDVERALTLLRSDERIDLLLTDVGLPGMDGRELARAARIARPALPVLFITGYTPHSLELRQFLSQGMDMMTKPYDAQALLARIAGMLAAMEAPAGVA